MCRIHEAWAGLPSHTPFPPLPFPLHLGGGGGVQVCWYIDLQYLLNLPLVYKHCCQVPQRFLGRFSQKNKNKLLEGKAVQQASSSKKFI